MRILISGGAGFIGSHLLGALLAQGHQVRVLDNLSTGKQQNISQAGGELIVGDVADWEMVQTAVSGCDLVYHLAAQVSVPRSMEAPNDTFQTNVIGTANILEAARLAGVSRVVYASSAAVYGNHPQLPKTENSPLVSLSPYAASKHINEVQANGYFGSYSLTTVGLRFMNVFGPRQDPASPYSGVLSLFCHAAVSDGGVTIYGDGQQTRDFVYVADVVQGLLQAGAVPEERLRETAVFNIGRGEQTSLNQIVQILRDITQRPIPVRYAPERAGDIRYSVANIDLAHSILGYKPAVSIREGLEQTLRWFANK